MVHVPFSGSAPALQSLVTGDVQAMFSSPSTTLQMPSPERCESSAWPAPRATPTCRYPDDRRIGLPGFQSNTWFALMASAKVPAEVLDKIRLDAIRAMHEPTCANAFSAPARRRSETARRNSARSSRTIWKSTVRSSPKIK